MKTGFLAAPMLVAALAFSAAPAAAQHRGGGMAVGHAAPRGVAARPYAPRAVPARPYAPRGVAVPRPYYPYRGYGYYPYRPYYYRPYYYPYYAHYPYYYPYYGSSVAFGISVGFGYGFGGYGYGGYGYGYPYYGYPYYAYPYAGYYPPSGGYVSAQHGERAYGGLRITGAPPESQVYADGYYIGTVGESLTLEAGPHRIEIRVPGVQPIVVDVNVRAGDTITYNAAIR